MDFCHITVLALGVYELFRLSLHVIHIFTPKALCIMHEYTMWRVPGALRRNERSLSGGGYN